MVDPGPNRRGSGLEIAGLSVRYPRAAVPVLRGVDLGLPAGASVGLTGRSGVGKTTLLHTVAGLVPWLSPAAVTGELRIDNEAIQDLDPGQRAHLLATCLDRPDAQLFLATVGQEIETARRLYRGGGFTDAVVEGFALGPLLERRVTDLSSGERQRVALAVALAGCPLPILLDEPTAHLDLAGEEALIDLLRQAECRGAAIAISEQAGWRLGGVVNSWFEIAGGVLDPARAPRVPEVSPPHHEPGSDVVLSCRGMTVSRDGRTLVENIDLDLHEGEVVFLSGPNGSGKSTFARTLAGLSAPAVGELEKNGRVALMLPEADLQLFASTVVGEVTVAGASQEERARVLRRHRLEHLAARAPWTLSRGEQQRLVHAALDMIRPDVMIVDEPAQGLDRDDLLDLLELIRRRSAKGRAYLVISHREELAAAAHRRFALRDHRLEEVSS